MSKGPFYLGNANTTKASDKLRNGDLATLHSISDRKGELPILLVECYMTTAACKIIDEIIAVAEGSVVFLLEDVETTKNQNTVVHVLYNDAKYLCISGQLKKIVYDV